MELLQSKTSIGGEIYLIADILADSNPIRVEQREGGILATFPQVEVLFKEDSVEQAKRQGDSRSLFRPVNRLDQLLIRAAQAAPMEKEIIQMPQQTMVKYTNDRLPGRVIPLANEKALKSIGTYAATLEGMESVTEDQLVTWYQSLPEGDERTNFADFLQRFQIPVDATAQETPIPQDNSPAPGTGATSDGATSDPSKTGGTSMIDTPNVPAGNTPSDVFNKPAGKAPKTPSRPKKDSPEALELRARYERDEALATRIVKSLDEGAIQVIKNLGYALAVFGGKVGVYAPLTASDTRVKAEFPSKVPAKDRDWHPDFKSNPPDPSLTGSKIPLGQSNVSFDMNLVESAPGVIQGFVIYAPPGVTFDMLENFHSEVRRQDLAHVLARVGEKPDPSTYQLVYVSRKRFQSLLRYLGVEAIEVSLQNRTALPGAQTWEIVPRRSKDSQAYSYILKSYKLGTSAPPSGGNFVPLKTFATAPVAESDPVALTNFIFKALNNKLAGSTVTRYERLLEEHKAKFSGEGTNRIYNGFTGKASVPSFNRSGDTVSLDWPSLPYPEDGATAAVNPKKLSYTEDDYNPKYKNVLAPVRDLLGDVAKSRKSSAGRSPKINLQRVRSEAIAAMLHGTDIGDKDFDPSTLV